MASQALLQPSAEGTTQLSVSQSSALVQIFLNAAIACIAHTRELIPWTSTCFQTRYVNDIQLEAGETSDLYGNFCNGTTKTSGESQEFRILQRGKDKKADRILDMLEGGASDALNRNFLTAMQMLIAVSPSDPSSALETYTFQFDYECARVSQISVSPHVSTPFALNDIHRSFSTSIRTLLKSLKNLSRLPRRRSIGVSLLYNDNCPNDYQPAGFLDIRRDYITPSRGCWTDLWQRLPTPVTEFTTGRLRVSVGGKSLQFNQNMSCSRLQDTKLSIQLQNMQKTSSHNPDVPPTAASPPNDCSHRSDFSIDQKISARKTSQTTTNIPDNRDSNSDLSIDNQVQSGKNKHRSTTATETSIRAVNHLSKLTVASKNRRRRNVAVSKLAELLVQAQAIQNNHTASEELFDEDQLRDGKIKRVERSGPIKCECGGRHENEQMLLCELCGTQQHKVCYGYDTLRQGCCPEEHFCYDCVLLPRETTTSESMPDIVHMRLALLYLAKQSSSRVEIDQHFLESVFPSSDSMANLLRTIDRLTDEGYLNERTDGHVHVLPTADRGAAQTTYLEPLAGIVHHYQIVRDGDTTEKRRTEVLKALRSYAKDRPFSFEDKNNSGYDRVHVKSNAGQEIVRWGFYSGWKRKRAAETPDSAASHQKKISLSTAFVRIDRSTPSEVMSMDEAITNAVDEAEWILRLKSRSVSEETNFN